MRAEQFALSVPESRLYYVYGPESYLFDNAVGCIKKKYGADELNTDIREGNVDKKDIEELVSALPFFSEKRIVILEEPGFLAPPKQKDGKKTAEADLSTEETKEDDQSADPECCDIEGIIHALKDIPDTTVLIICTKKTPDKRRNIVKFLLNNAVCAEATKPDARSGAIEDFVYYEARRQGVNIERHNIPLLLEIAGEDMGTLVNEITKLSFLGHGNITSKDITETASHTADYDAFQLHNLMLDGKMAEALDLCGKIMRNDKTFIPTLVYLGNRFNNLYMARSAIAAGLSGKQAEEKVSEAAKIHPYAAKMAVRECRSFSLAALKRSIKLISDYDKVLKTSDADPGVESFLLKLYTRD